MSGDKTYRENILNEHHSIKVVADRKKVMKVKSNLICRRQNQAANLIQTNSS
jgi:hypothetical protein